MADLVNTQNSEGAAQAASLRDRIEDLAVQVVLGDISAGSCDSWFASLAEALTELSDQARRKGWAAVGDLAGKLVDSIGSGRDPAAIQQALQHGIVELQTMAENQPETQTVVAEPPQVPAASVNPLAQDPELLTDFINESREHLTAIESQALVLEQDPGNSEAVHSVFRSFHTIKGLSGFLELLEIQKVAHETETVLDLARNRKLAITPAVIDVVLDCADYLTRAVQVVESRLRGTEMPSVPDYRVLLDRVLLLQRSEPEPPDAKDLVRTGPIELVGTPVEPETSEPAADEQTADAESQPSAPEAQTPAAEVHVPAAPAAEEAPRAAARTQVAGLVSVRVDAAKLDYLMDMVGEMVIAQSLLRHEPALAEVENPRLLRNLSQLARATSEVQRTAMALRMVPIGNVFQRTARVLRDLVRKTGKQVTLETSGEETELDKSIAEEVVDPLMHMVRNSLDHGIEDPETRAASGKQPVGRVRLAAYHQSGQIVIEISDDGRGLDREKIFKKAVSRGLVDKAAHLTDSECFNLIFEPGFSTAEQITDVSGRGVGMDVVRKHVQKLRGRIDIESTAGRGTRFMLKLPLTLAIIEGLVIGVGAHRYIVPIFAVKEMFRPAEGQVYTIENQDETVEVRGRMLPIVRLHRRFGVEPRSENPCEALLIVSEAEGRQFCLMVDELIGKQEVVIKSLGEMLKATEGVAGGAILGDGRVGLILDMAGVFRGRANA
jgi:two-component system chemotaxis sensor kinase CheA